MEIKAEKREQFGTKTADAIRAKGLIPAELYGHGISNLHLTVNAKEFSKVFSEAGESTLVTVVLGTEKRPVLISSVDVDPIKGSIRHADFYQVRLDEKIKAHVPLIFIGTALGVKEKGGTLIQSMREIEIEALPADLPHDIKVDISSLDDIGKSLYVKDLPKVKGIAYEADPETVIVTISAHVEEEIQTGPASIDEIKVETEEKKKEREAAEAAENKSAE